MTLLDQNRGGRANVVAQRIINAPRHDVYDWLADSRNYTASPMVIACPWRRPGDEDPFGAGAVRDVFMAAGWYQETITSTTPDRQIDYRVLRSLPPVTQDFSRITLTDAEEGTCVTWEVDVHVRAPIVGALLTRASSPVASALYGTILAAADRALTPARSPGEPPTKVRK